MTNDYVRLVRDDQGKVIDSFDANPEFEALRMEIALQANMIKDLRELLANTRHIALEVEQQAAPPASVYIYRTDEGFTQVMAPKINDHDLVIDMLQEGLRAMTEGEPIVRN
jgi:hypothetical protein